MTAISLIGYWRAEGDWTSDYPDPRDWIDPDWDENERHATWAYFVSGTLFRTFMGLSPCRICGENNGASEYTDGTYAWPEGLAHYVIEHAVRLPDDVIAHALQRLEAVADLEADTEWWLGVTAKKLSLMPLPERDPADVRSAPLE